jgi:hypothetical protein
VGSQYGAMTDAAESLIAQLYSQGKFNARRRKNLKILHENKILKANEPALMRRNFRSTVLNDNKKHKTKSREITPLSKVFKKNVI